MVVQHRHVSLHPTGINSESRVLDPTFCTKTLSKEQTLAGRYHGAINYCSMVDTHKVIPRKNHSMHSLPVKISVSGCLPSIGSDTCIRH